jgi:hypothetical protein
MRILVSGTRETLTEIQKKVISDIMDRYNGEGDHTLIHGGCTGVDTFAFSLAEEKGWTVITEMVDWSLGRSAGPIRNRKMVEVHTTVST